MNINKKYIIIFGTLILLLVVTTGAITYYNEKAEQSQISDKGQSILRFSQNYPVNHQEFLNFIDFCGGTVYSNIKALMDKEIKETVCTIVKDEFDNTFIPIFLSLDSVVSLKSGKYIGISINTKDIIKELNPTFLEEEKLYFCNISEPSWGDPSVLQMEPKQTLIFDEGDISCVGVRIDQKAYSMFSGFVPQAESLRIIKYLVDEQTVFDVMNKQSFFEAKEILKDYPIIWQMEKPIVL